VPESLRHLLIANLLLGKTLLAQLWVDDGRLERLELFAVLR